jgi:hypothetical protein
MPVSQIKSPFTWSESRRVYLYRSNGRVVSTAKLQEWVETAVTQAKSNLRGIGQALLDGAINKSEFALRSASEIRNMHRALGLLANGGRNQITVKGWGQIGGILKRELGYLQRFSALVDGIELSSLSSAFLNRIESYGNAGRFTYASAVRAREIAAGGMEERNVLGGSGKSCSDCLDEAAMEWQPVGVLSEPGTRLCGPGCACSLEFRAVSASGEITSEVA